MKKILKLASFVFVIIFTACSSEEIATNDNKVEVTENHFSFSPEHYTSDETLTRAATTSVTPQVVDLGDGLQAEVNIEQDKESPQTRATQPISDGHYTIYAIDATGTRVTGTNSKVSGTVSGGVFTKDAGTKLELTPGTYTFVCFNDAVTDNGTNLTVASDNDALIGTATETISGNAWHVNFLMKHQTARVRFRFTGYTDQAVGVTAKFTFTSPQPVVNTYSVDASTITPTTGTSANSYTMPTTSTTFNTKYVQAHDFLTNYSYVLPDIPTADTKLTFTAGTIYGKALTGKSFSLSKLSSLLFERNHSYTVSIKLKTILYLFEDGTVGVLAEKGSRTPIGVVANEKTNTEAGLACALRFYEKNSLGFTGECYWKNTDDHIEENVSPSPTNMVEAAADMNGYNWTYSPNLQGVVRANEPVVYPGFYLAAHYSPGITVTGTNVGKWFLPAYGQLMKLAETIGFTPLTFTTDEDVWGHYKKGFPYGLADKLEQIVKDANPSIDYMDGRLIITSTQVTLSGGFRPMYALFQDDRTLGAIIQTGTCWNTMENSCVLPFVEF